MEYQELSPEGRRRRRAEEPHNVELYDAFEKLAAHSRKRVAEKAAKSAALKNKKEKVAGKMHDISASSITHINGKPVSKSKYGYGIDEKTGKRTRFLHKEYK